ncbi:hypothetical protein [Thiolapillus sp.]
MNTSLYLFPLPVLDVPPPVSVIEDLLQACGLAGKALEAHRYLAGSEFFRHITFAGCSPHLQLERPADGGWDFCHVSLITDRQPPQLHIAPGRSRPRCPSCRTGVSDWKENLPAWQKDSSQPWRCEACGQPGAVAMLDWRQYGFGARCAVEIHQIYPGEAMPGDTLMRLLSEGTGREWRHAWAGSSTDEKKRE